MNCWHCNTELIWGADADIEEDFQPVLYAEYSMVSNFSCPKCCLLYTSDAADD